MWWLQVGSKGTRSSIHINPSCPSLLWVFIAPSSSLPLVPISLGQTLFNDRHVVKGREVTCWQVGPGKTIDCVLFFLYFWYLTFFCLITKPSSLVFQAMGQASLKNSDVLILTGLTQIPTANPDGMVGEFCSNLGTCPGKVLHGRKWFTFIFWSPCSYGTFLSLCFIFTPSDAPCYDLSPHLFPRFLLILQNLPLSTKAILKQLKSEGKIRMVVMTVNLNF